MRQVPFCINCLLLCFLGNQFSAGDDWPEFRGGIHGFGHAGVALPTKWSETDNIVWKVPIKGVGWSSPVVAGNAIYLTTSVGEGDGLKDPQSLRVLRLDGATGQERWNVELFRQPGRRVEVHKKNSHASPTPVIESNRIYVHFGSSGTACVTTAGDVVWKKTLEYAPLHGNGGSPLVAGGMLIICCDGRDVQYVVGLDKETGDVKWKQDRNCEASRGFSFCTPTLIEVAGQAQAVCPGSGKVVAYDPESGKEIWHVTYGEGYSVVPRPVFANGLVYVCSGFGDGRLFAIDPSGKGDVTNSHVKWEHKGGVPQSPSVLVVDNELYMVSDRGVGTCLNATSGKEIWKERLGGGFSASPTHSNGFIYFSDEKGTTTVIKTGPKFDLVSKNKLGDGKERTFASFAVTDHAILLRSERHLYRIQNGK